MHHSLIKRIILLTLALFFLAGLAIAFHHHDNTLLLAARSICKTKAAISGTMGKNKSDPATAVTVISVGGVVFPLLTTVVAENTTTISSQSTYIWPNKAPPAKS
jgi:uncharacterized membrane protein YadS